MSSNAWLERVQQIQKKKITPEIREKMRKKAVRSQQLNRRKKKCKAYKRAAVANKRAWGQGYSKAIRSAPQQMREAIQVNQCQMKSIQGVYHNYSDNEDEMEDMLDCIEVVQQEDEVQVDDSDFQQILNKLKIEPKNDEELAAKFALYEDFLKTVVDSRKATFVFWEECRADFVEVKNVIAHIERDLKAIDKEDNMAINWVEHRWFVHDMTVKADQNNESIKRVLASIETKMDLLQRDEDCPFCLENIQAENLESVTLGCCHKACKPCWDEWQKLQGRRAFCPLCREEDFLCELAR